jgi:hypothetical protein
LPLFKKARSDVPRSWADALTKALKPVDPTGKVAEFVLTGQPAAALQAVKLVNSWSGPLTRFPGSGAKDNIAALYAGSGQVDATVLRRWGMALDAAQGNFIWGLALGDLAGCHWPELMLQQAAAAVAPSAPLPVTFADLERIAAVDGTPASSLVRMIFTLAPHARYQLKTARGHLLRLPGLGHAVAAHTDVAASALRSGSADQRVAAATLLDALEPGVLSLLAEPFAEAATAGSAKVREAAVPVLSRIGAAATEPLRRLATEAEPSRRAYALELLAARPDQRAWAVQTAEADRAASVQALTARWQSADTITEPAEDLLPELPALPSWSIAVADADRIAHQVLEAARRAIEAHNRSLTTLRQRHPNWQGSREIPEPPRGAAARLAGMLAAHGPAQVADKLDGIPEIPQISSQVTAALQKERCSAAAATQVMAALGWLTLAQAHHRPWSAVIEDVHARTGGPDLLTIQRMIDAVGANGRSLVWSAYRASFGPRIGRGWPGDQVWPFVAHNLDWIVGDSARGQSPYPDENAFFEAVATFPRPPARLLDHLYTLALGTRKTERARAQAALERDRQRAARAATALLDGRADIRLAAAQWLSRIADPDELPALRTAWQKERQDVVRGALLDALIAIGEDAGTYLDPAKTAATAASFVAKGMPSSVAWVDWSALPDLTWASSGDAVPREVLQWLCGTAVKTRSPEPDAVLRHYAALFDTAARERLASHLLAAWLREDLRPFPPAEAEAQAARAASSYYRFYSSPGGLYAGMSLEQVTMALLPGYLKTPAGSAIASKGILAVVAACGGRDVVPPVERYLKEWYGHRTAQGMALIALLAWVNDPNATQLVLAVGSRFRTKGIQEEAVRQAAALAERNGWTVDELADRTIPTAGFDDAGLLELTYGPRTFTAVLRPDLTIELRDPDGKVIKSLPAPRQSDDADQAKQAQKAFAAARKEIKSIAAMQTQRLYEAMCTERSWSAEEWDRYLLRHPVFGPAVRRLVWVTQAGEEEGDRLIFRPLDDGSLTDADDNEVELPALARIRVAHDSALSAEEVAQWTAHLADYQVTPLFQQLGRGVHAISAQLRTQRGLADFTGYILEAFALRGRAGKLGYTRGPTEDGGWFYNYQKRFPTLGIVATIKFTGNQLPEQNRLVALEQLSFRRTAPDGRDTDLTLGDVPAVLVSECWQDLRQLAADGTGFDPEWEKKAAF